MILFEIYYLFFSVHGPVLPWTAHAQFQCDIYKKFESKLITGSTIMNWDKVKTWLDQMFWQTYQKLMLSGFLSSGSLCLIHHLKFFWPHAASTASDRKGAKIQHEFSWFCQKSKHQNKVILDPKLLNSRTWKTLKSSVVIFQALETSPASLTSAASATSLASTASKAQFSQKTSWSWWSDHHWQQNNQ